jgi:hypothetical protein
MDKVVRDADPKTQQCVDEIAAALERHYPAAMTQGKCEDNANACLAVGFTLAGLMLPHVSEDGLGVAHNRLAMVIRGVIDQLSFEADLLKKLEDSMPNVTTRPQ